MTIILVINILADNNSTKDEHEEVVRGLMEAFNAHDTETLMHLVTDDVKWLYIIHSDSLSIETSGRVETEHAFIDYFKSVPSIRSEIEDLIVSGNYVAVRERVFWEKDGELLSKSSFSVYQIRDNKVSNVW
jgi:hypothetical protein